MSAQHGIASRAYRNRAPYGSGSCYNPAALNDAAQIPSRVGAALWKAHAKLFGSGIARNVQGTSHTRGCLFLSQVAPFRFPHAPTTHQNEGQFRETARALSEVGYDVDVVDYGESRPLLDRDYELVIDLHPRERPLYEGRLRPGAKRVCYITGSNPAFSNAEEQARLEYVKSRRGAILEPRRQVPPFPKHVLESFDAMFLFGGRFALSTYAEFRLPPVHHLVNNGYDDVSPTASARRDPSRFLFMASVGQVHRGLDLLLEIFAEERDLSLTVCSMVASERDFARAYRRELFDTPNIRAAGFLDVKSAEFLKLQAECGAMILPSCSEGISGSVTAAMSFGLPCIVSAACGFEEPELTVLPDCRIETIRAAVRRWASQPRSLIQERSERTLALMRRAYTPADFARSIRSALRSVVGPGGAR